MKFACTADLHFSVYSNDKIDPSTGYSERLMDIINTFKNMLNICRKKDISNICIAGDVNHNKSVIYSLSQSVLLDIIRSYNDMTFYTINGNHDMSSKGQKAISSLKSLDNERNVVMIHEPQKIENILFVPWSPSGMNDYIKNNSGEMLISHFGLNEAQLSSGISIVSDLKLSDVSNYDKVILGHYHKPQEFSNVIYCGSLIQLDRGEKHEDKRFLIVDSDSGQIDSIESEGYRKYYNLSITSDNIQDTVEKGKQLQEQGHRVTFEKEEQLDTKELEQDFKIVDKSEKDITDRGLNMSMSKSDICQTYLNIQKISENEQKTYMEIALEIINEAEEV